MSVFYRSPAKTYPTVSHASGIYLWDTAGKRYLDGSSGALVVNIGHGRQEVAEAIARQAATAAFAHTLRFTSEAQESLAALIAERMGPEPYFSYFVSGGSEAAETAIKLCRQYHLERGDTQRYKVLTRWACYHGNTLGALAASGHIARRRPYLPLLPQTAFAHFDVPKASHPDGERCDCLEHVEARIQQEDPAAVSAVMVEIVGGSALSGFVAHPGYFQGLQDLCRRYGILLVVDEVMTGVGRTGDWWAHRAEGIQPDLMILAKGLASGYSPLGAVVAAEAVWNTLRSGSGTFAHGLTFGGNPVSAAAGAAVMNIMAREGLVENARLQGAYLSGKLHELQAASDLIVGVRGRGLMQGLVLRSAPGRPGAVAAALAQDAFDHGLLVYSGSGSAQTVEGDHVLVGPPLTIARGQIDELMELLAASVERISSDVPAR